MAKKEKNANYDFKKQKEPEKPMGSGSFANMPKEPIYGSFGEPELRDGLINSFSCSVKELSKIHENQR